MQVAQGHGLIAPELTRRLITHFAAHVPDPERSRDLTGISARERDVLQQIALGKTNSDIAQSLFIEESTVKPHVSSLLLKLGLQNRVQAVITAYETGLVTPGRPRP